MQLRTTIDGLLIRAGSHTMAKCIKRGSNDMLIIEPKLSEIPLRWKERVQNMPKLLKANKRVMQIERGDH